LKPRSVRDKIRLRALRTAQPYPPAVGTRMGFVGYRPQLQPRGSRARSMNEPSEHERVIELLRRARRPPEEITPEHLEENLRWLIRISRPEMQAPEALRQRVEAMTAAHRARRPSLFARLFTDVLPEHRRTLLSAISLAVACILLLLLLTARAPAQMLARTLQAMAQVRSAHCIGMRVEYRGEGEGRQPVPERMRVEWWYKAPDWYRKEMEPEPLGGNAPSNQLVVKGERNVLISQLGPTSTIRTALRPATLTLYLSPLDFFSPQGFLHRAETEKAGQVTNREATYHDRQVQIVDVEMAVPQGAKMCRARWTLYVDPASDLVLRSEARFARQAQDGTWQALEEEILDRLEYNVSVKDSLFDIEPPIHPRHPKSP
jgi:hypothetical protein